MNPMTTPATVTLTYVKTLRSGRQVRASKVYYCGNRTPEQVKTTIRGNLPAATIISLV